MVKNNINISSKFKKIIVYAGLILLALAVITTLFIFINISHNPPFTLTFHRSLFYVYCGRFAITLLGGFGIGLLFAWLANKKLKGKAKQSLSSVIITATSFGLLTFITSSLIDSARLLIRHLFGTLSYPWEMIMFEGMSLIALLLVLMVGLIAYLKRASISAYATWFQQTFIFAFVLAQVALLISLPFLNYAEISAIMVIIAIFGLITSTPIVIAAVAYLCLGTLKDVLFRLFIASFIGTIFSALTYMLWEFRINPEAGATELFSYGVTGVTLISTVVMIVLLRKASK